MLLGTILPEGHLSPDARDVIKVAMAMVATLAAPVLGLLTASAKRSLDEKESELRRAHAQVLLLDRTMAEYGPETKDARDLLKQTVAARISQIWPDEKANVIPDVIGRGTGIEAVQRKLLDRLLRQTLSAGFSRQRCRSAARSRQNAGRYSNRSA